LPFLEAVILDVDGVLIDSEPFWRQSEIEVFARHGVALTEADCMLTTGMRIDEVTRYWHERKPWRGSPPDELAREILAGVIRRIEDRGRPMPGLRRTIRLFRLLSLRLALASSSARSLIDAVVARLDIGPHIEAICSAEDEARGKPYPDVYLAAAARLGVPPERCLAVEDSIAGVTAAKAAGMRCIAVPLPELRRDSRYLAADAVVDSLSRIDRKLLKSLGVDTAGR
jgi:HAD superfamily hydrolase (TIGR01509 family)